MPFEQKNYKTNHLHAVDISAEKYHLTLMKYF